MAQHGGADPEGGKGGFRDRVLAALREMSVLVADADAVAREQIAAMLRTMGAEVNTADDAASALEALEAFSPDVLAVAVDLPGTSGLELAEAARAMDEDLHIVAMAGVDQPEFLIRAAERDLDGLLIKPVLPDMLLAAMGRAVKVMDLRRRAAESEISVRLVMDTYPNFVILVDEGRVAYVNEAFLRYLDYSGFEEFQAGDSGIHDHIVRLNGETYDGDKSAWLDELVDGTLDREHVLHLENPRHPSRRPGAFVAACREFPRPGRYIVTLSDITELDDEMRNLEDKAGTDPLTGILNRRRFLEFAAEAEAKAGDSPWSLIMFDIDHFKSVNDTFGHDAGDVVLKEIAALVLDSVRVTDVFARWGGEEFMIFAPGSSLSRGRRVAERLRRGVAGKDFTGIPRAVTSSFGVVQRGPGEDLDACIRRVDASLYKAKEQGRNRVVAG